MRDCRTYYLEKGHPFKQHFHVCAEIGSGQNAYFIFSFAHLSGTWDCYTLRFQPITNQENRPKKFWRKNWTFHAEW